MTRIRNKDFGVGLVADYLSRFDITRLQQLVKLGAEFARVVLPHRAVFIIQPIFLQREPVRLVGSRFRNQVNLKAGLTKHLKWMQGFGDEEAC